MLHVLQYLVGTSIAAVTVPSDLIMVHFVVGGPNVSGSSEFLDGSKGCRFRGNIFSDILAGYNISSTTFDELTPGSVTDACMKDDKQIKKRYAKMIGMAGDTSCQKYGPLMKINKSPCKDLNAVTYETERNKAEGNTTRIPVATLIGLSRVFCNLPPQQNTVLPVKY